MNQTVRDANTVVDWNAICQDDCSDSSDDPSHGSSTSETDSQSESENDTTVVKQSLPDIRFDKFGTPKTVGWKTRKS